MGFINFGPWFFVMLVALSNGMCGLAVGSTLMFMVNLAEFLFCGNDKKTTSHKQRKRKVNNED